LIEDRDGAAADGRDEGGVMPGEAITILHLSDPQFGHNHLFGSSGLDAATREPLRALRSHAGRVQAVAFEYDRNMACLRR